MPDSVIIETNFRIDPDKDRERIEGQAFIDTRWVYKNNWAYLSVF